MRIPSGCSVYDRNEIIDRVKGLIFGTVLGDSLGLATEGMTLDQVTKAYGKGPIQFGLDDELGKSAPFLRDAYRQLFDDNDFGSNAEQLMLTIQSLVDNDGHFNYQALAALLKEHSLHGLRGLRKTPVGTGPAEQPAIFHPDFLSSPKLAAEHVWKTKDRMRGAKSALVRCLVLGVPKFWDGTTVVENTAQCCKLTHPDPRCLVPSIILATLVARILRGQEKEANHATLTSLQVKDIKQASLAPARSDGCFLDSLPANEDIVALVHSVIHLHKRILVEPNTDPLFRTPETDRERLQLYYKQLLAYGLESPHSLASLQLGNVKEDEATFQCLGVSLYAFTRKIAPGSETECFKKILMDVVMQGGDADVNAAVTGGLLGARIGYSRLPSEWVIGLRRWEWLEDRVEELCHLL